MASPTMSTPGKADEGADGSARLFLCGVWLHLLPSGAVWWPEARLLVVSDLHLEKGSAYAAQGQMLPPHDTAATLSRIEVLAETYRPETIIALGDSFHDRGAETRLASACKARLRSLTGAFDWLWVEGNHDPAPPLRLGGRAMPEYARGPLVFRHEPTGMRGEIAGHLHPCARVRGRGRALRRACFLSDGERLVCPAMGALTGGLNARRPAFDPIFPEGFIAFVLGTGRVFALPRRQLVDDVGAGPAWRL